MHLLLSQRLHFYLLHRGRCFGKDLGLDQGHRFVKLYKENNRLHPLKGTRAVFYVLPFF